MFVVVIAHVYETLFMFRYWERDRLSKERLEAPGFEPSSMRFNRKSIRISCTTA